jgi:4-amino-4-deoxy-L-arabinose transferase-like glycosyltransferase
MPGYPLFLAACAGSAKVARVAQAFVDASTALAIYLLARRWMSSRWSTAAAAIVALNPFLIYFSGLILSETLFTALLAWGIYLLNVSGPLGVLVLIASVMVRPSGIGLLLLLTIAAALLNRQRRAAYPRSWPLPPATTALLLLLAALTPWAYRNYKLLGHWVWTTTNGGITVYDGFNDDATGASDQRFTRSIPGLVQAGEMGRDAFFADEASHWIDQHPKRSLELAGAKAIRTWSPVPLSSEYGRPLYQWIGGLYAIPLDVFIVLGLCYGRLTRGAKVFLLLPAIYVTVIHAMSVGSLRYRLPAEPPMALLAVAGCQLLVASKGNYRLASGDGSSLATGN